MDHTNAINSIRAISPLDGRYGAKVESLRDYTSEFGLIRYRVEVEVEWLIFLTERKEIDTLSPLKDEDKKALRKIVQEFSPENGLEIKETEKVTNHDVKAVEYFINNRLQSLGLEALVPMVHFACTSEDINNLSYGLMLKNTLNKVIFPAFNELMSTLGDKAEEYRDAAMMSRTHGQPASPTTMGKEFHNVVQRLQRQYLQLKNQLFLGKMNGAVGNYNAHVVSFPAVDWRKLSADFIESLGLTVNPATTQIEPHDYIAEIFHNLSRWNTILLDFCRDIWSYISIEAFKQKAIPGQVGSSTMPHKINPIDFENAEGNLGLANALLGHMAAKLPVSRWQRDLSDSTVLRNIGTAFGYSLLSYNSTLAGLKKLSLNKEHLLEELQDAWLILGEALQTVMRKYEVPEAYEKLKELTRGKEVDHQVIRDFIHSLDLPEEVKGELEQLTPQTYLGLAKEF